MNFSIGEIVETPHGIKTIREIVYFNGDKNVECNLDSFYMKEDCVNTQSGCYKEVYDRKDINKIKNTNHNGNNRN